MDSIPARSIQTTSEALDRKQTTYNKGFCCLLAIMKKKKT
jgi:hypothetical protein